tara:strand:+ start:1183 stop:1431 length:249 start_codon:yes stop_codon:yes gene_type:complete
MTIYNFIQQQKLSTAILLYLMIMGILIYTKPSFLFNVDDSIKQFGIGYQSKTVLPLSIMAILTAILSYIIVLYYLNYARMKF